MALKGFHGVSYFLGLLDFGKHSLDQGEIIRPITINVVGGFHHLNDVLYERVTLNRQEIAEVLDFLYGFVNVLPSPGA